MKLIIDYNEDDLGSYYFTLDEIRINLSIIKDSCDKYKSNFYTLLMHVINHEFLHYILYIEQNDTTSGNLDNLTWHHQTESALWEYWLT